MAQTPASRVLFRVFLSDGRVLASYGEWARVEDRVVFSIPTRLTSDPVELHLVNIASARVDWPRTELYAESVRAVAYAETRGEADFGRFSADLAKALNDVSRIADPGVRLATAERAMVLVSSVWTWRRSVVVEATARMKSSRAARQKSSTSGAQ